jgi:cytochrome c peroxidase
MKKSVFMACLCLAILIACNKENEMFKPYSINATISDDDLILDVVDKSTLILPLSTDLASIPQDPKNPLTTEKVQLGQLLFHETKLAANPKVNLGLFTYSCATCHHAEAGFQSGLAQAIAEGGKGFGITGEGRVPANIFTDSIDVQPVKTPASLNMAYQEVIMWEGSLGSTGVNAGTEALWTKFPSTMNALGFQGLETQAIAGQTAHHLKADTSFLSGNATYKNLFDQAFASLPADQRITTNTIAMAIAAYERTLLANEAPFQKWLRGDKTAMTANQKAGAKLFFGKALCSSCHNGPALNSMAFYALGMGDLQNGINGAIHIPADNNQKGRGDFTKADSDMFKFKVPQLYNLKDVKFYGHGSTFSSISDVVHYINNAILQNTSVPVSNLPAQFKPLNLTEDEMSQIVAFIEDALRDPNLIRYEPATVPSGNCIPNNDKRSRIDRGCQ